MLEGGGAERVMINLAQIFAEDFGLKVDLVLASAEGILLAQVSPSVNIVDLKSSGVLKSLPKLIRYLRQNRPFAILSTLEHANIIAIWAKYLSFTKTRVVVRIANTISVAKQTDRRLRLLAKIFYRQANHIIAVSQGVKKDTSQNLNFSSERIYVIKNPVFFERVIEKAAETPTDKVFDSMVKTVIAVGRLHPQKDFPTLIKAFKKLNILSEKQLIILGEGHQRMFLESLIKDLGLVDEVYLLGFKENPYSYIKNADVFVLSSLYEGFPNVLLEAMACGCPIVSTDCPSGPREIIDDPHYGKLVPVGNSEAMADAILEMLENPTPPEILYERLQAFSPLQIAEQYLKVLRGE